MRDMRHAVIPPERLPDPPLPPACLHGGGLLGRSPNRVMRLWERGRQRTCPPRSIHIPTFISSSQPCKQLIVIHQQLLHVFHSMVPSLPHHCPSTRAVQALSIGAADTLCWSASSFSTSDGQSTCVCVRCPLFVGAGYLAGSGYWGEAPIG